MKESLPDYIVNCMLAAGYDDIKIISAMDVTDSEGNSISIIENFIEKRFKGDPDYCHNHISKSSLPFEFPPGHRLRICNFVHAVKKMYRTSISNKSHLLTCKRKRTTDQHNFGKAKKFKLSDHIAVPSAGSTEVSKQVEITKDKWSDESQDESIILNSVRQRLNKWMQQQTNTRLSKLKENNDYTIIVEASSQNSVCVKCNACSTSINLHKKDKTRLNSSYLLSNWTKHVKSCTMSEVGNAKQHSLKDFLQFHSTKGLPSSVTKSENKISIPTSSHSYEVDNHETTSIEQTDKRPDKCEGIAVQNINTCGDDHFCSVTTNEEVTRAVDNITDSTDCQEDLTTHSCMTKSPKLDNNNNNNAISSPNLNQSNDVEANNEMLNTVDPSSELTNTKVADVTLNKMSDSENPTATSDLHLNSIKLTEKVVTSNVATSSISTDWSRSARNQRSLIIASKDPAQTKITDYWKVLEDIEKLQLKNKQLAELLQHQLNRSSHENSYSPCSLTPILKQILLNITKNSDRNGKQRRHNEIVKRFCTALFIYAGPLAYEFIQSNMQQALPSVRTIQRVIYSEYKTITEGLFRFDELEKHIELYGCPKIVSIAEDATRIIARVDYDSETDRCVGFVLPVNQKGLPIVDSYLASSFVAIESMFVNSPTARYAYVYMAQPLQQDIPPFCLACLGTDNKFTAAEVMQRWNHIYEECKKRNIYVLSYAGDGDSRLMKGMRVSTSLTVPSTEPLLKETPSYLHQAPSIPKAWKTWFNINPRPVAYIQDTVHLAVKLKARLLKPSVILPLGPYVATPSHLHIIKMSCGKEIHGMRDRDINHKDKQNFNAVLHLVKAASLLDTLPDSLGTKCYLEVIQCVIDSYLDKSLSPLERITKIWYATFFLRLWRQWLLQNSKYTLKSNFITGNAFKCVELNAHAMITLLIALRDNCKSNHACFLPWLTSSQTCETTFRDVRSMSSTFSTIINFSMLSLLRRLHRLQIQSTLQANSEDTTGIIFPRIQQHQRKHGKNSYVSYSLNEYSNERILEAVQKAYGDAKAAMDNLGMVTLLKKHRIWKLTFQPSTAYDADNQVNYEDDFEDDDDTDDDDDDNESNEDNNSTNIIPSIVKEVCDEDPSNLMDDIESITQNTTIDKEVLDKLQETIHLKKITSTTIPMYQKDSSCDIVLKKSKQIFPFLKIITDDREFFIRKSTAVWVFQENERVSPDSLFRVRCKQPFTSETLQLPQNLNGKVPIVTKVISLGDICVFTTKPNWKIGQVLQFAKCKALGNTLNHTQVKQQIYPQKIWEYCVHGTNASLHQRDNSS